MAEQGNLFSPRHEPTVVAPVPRERPQRPIPRWLAILEQSLFVLLHLYVGAWLVLLPWGPAWTTNGWTVQSPALASFIAHGWVRGVVSGLGLLNIWIGFVALFRGRHR